MQLHIRFQYIIHGWVILLDMSHLQQNIYMYACFIRHCLIVDFL